MVKLKEALVSCFKDNAHENAIDAAVIGNLVLVYFETDVWKDGAMLSLAKSLRTIICIIYLIEFALRFMLDWKGMLLREHLLKIELIVVIVAVLGVFLFPSKILMWRFSVFRAIRCVRLMRNARKSIVLADLWLVLVGYWQALRTVRWLGPLLLAATVIFGFGARGLIYAGPDDDLTNSVCGGDDFRVHLKCIDIETYFGTIPETMLTMMQLATMDRWAAHVVRPVMELRGEAAFFMIMFTALIVYGLLNIVTGVIVWSTVELAKKHDCHRQRVAVVQDRERIRNLRDYFDQCLQAEAKELLDYREVKEALMVPAVKKVYDELDLPVTDLNQLWAHLDIYAEGDISLDQFEFGCMGLLEPAKRLDMASLSARLNGRVQFAENLDSRCDYTIREMSSLFRRLSGGFAKMRQHVLEEDASGIFPEVGLRKAGKMHIPHSSDDSD